MAYAMSDQRHVRNMIFYMVENLGAEYEQEIRMQAPALPHGPGRSITKLALSLVNCFAQFGSEKEDVRARP